MTYTRVFSAAVLATIAILAGCKVGPDHAKPAEIVPERWIEAPTPATEPPIPSVVVDRAADLTRWWDVLNDATLTSLIERAAMANLDLAQADARIRAARASRDIAESGLYPGVGASAGYSRAGASGGPTTDLYRVGLDASWEIDVFGGVRRGIEAAESDLQSSIESRRDVLVTLTAEVALAYADLRGAQKQLAVATSNLQAQLETASIVRQRFEAGFVSRLDSANAETQAAGTRARIPGIETSIRRSIYSLSLLLARRPGDLLDELSPVASIPVVPPEVPVGLPSDLLNRRPDIRRAEEDVHSATARIGVAQANLLPKFALGASVGIAGPNFGNLGNINNGFWSIGPSASWNLFQGGALRAAVRGQEAAADASIAAYQQTVLTALSEVETSLVTYAKEQQRHAALVDAATSSRLAVELATSRYTEGISDFLDVLSAQGALYSSEDALAQSDRQVVQNLVTIYKSLGGGWEAEGQEPSPSPGQTEPR